MMSNGADPGLWVRRFHPAPDAPARLVCLPHAGGSASYFMPVSRALSPAVDVIAVQYPGRQDRRHEPAVASIADLADQITLAVRPWLDRPVAFFGHSMGAILAFEVALRLKRDGITPTGLFASGRRAPSTRRAENVHLRSDAEVVQEVRGLDGTDAFLLDDADLLNMILPALRSDYQAIETYEGAVDATVDCPIVALVGTEDSKATVAEVKAWEGHTTGGFTLRLFPGGHFYLNKHAPAVIRLVAEHLASAGLTVAR